jgi:glutathione peroxidase
MSYGIKAFAACPDYMQHNMRQLHSQNEVNLCQLLEQKTVLVVNTASHCGFTPQFKGLEQLHQTYADKGLVVVGFASDDFFQEDKDESKAADICYQNYGVTFTMLAPTSVRGKDANPVFKMLNETVGSPRWNFTKYLIDKEGEVVSRFGTRIEPNDPKLLKTIESLL